MSQATSSTAQRCAYCEKPIVGESTQIRNVSGAEFYENRLPNCKGKLAIVFKGARGTVPDCFICSSHVEDRWFGPPTLPTPVAKGALTYFPNTVKTMKNGKKVEYYPSEVQLENTCVKCGRVGVPFIVPANQTSAKSLSRFLNVSTFKGEFMCRVHLPKNTLNGAAMEFKHGYMAHKTVVTKVIADVIFCDHCRCVVHPSDSLIIRSVNELPRAAGPELIEIMNNPVAKPEVIRICRKHYAPGVIQENCSLCRSSYAPEFSMQNTLSQKAMSRFLKTDLAPRVRLCSHHVPQDFVKIRGGELTIHCVMCEYCLELQLPGDTYAGYIPSHLPTPLERSFVDRVFNMTMGDIRICRKHYKPTTTETIDKMRNFIGETNEDGVVVVTEAVYAMLEARSVEEAALAEANAAMEEVRAAEKAAFEKEEAVLSKKRAAEKAAKEKAEAIAFEKRLAKFAERSEANEAAMIARSVAKAAAKTAAIIKKERTKTPEPSTSTSKSVSDGERVEGSGGKGQPKLQPRIEKKVVKVAPPVIKNIWGPIVKIRKEDGSTPSTSKSVQIQSGVRIVGNGKPSAPLSRLLSKRKTVSPPAVVPHGTVTAIVKNERELDPSEIVGKKGMEPPTKLIKTEETEEAVQINAVEGEKEINVVKEEPLDDYESPLFTSITGEAAIKKEVE